jgi:hypothetical protein
VYILKSLASENVGYRTLQGLSSRRQPAPDAAATSRRQALEEYAGIHHHVYEESSLAVRETEALSSRLEELNRIPIGIFHLDLLPTWADFHLVAESNTSVLQQLNQRGEIFDA